MLLVLPGRLIAHWDLWCSLECTSACQAEGRGFKSRQVRKRYYRWGRVAQLVERAPEKREVTGSTPVSTTDSLLAIHLACFAFSLIGAFFQPRSVRTVNHYSGRCHGSRSSNSFDLTLFRETWTTRSRSCLTLEHRRFLAKKSVDDRIRSLLALQAIPRV